MPRTLIGSDLSAPLLVDLKTVLGPLNLPAFARRPNMLRFSRAAGSIAKYCAAIASTVAAMKTACPTLMNHQCLLLSCPQSLVFGRLALLDAYLRFTLQRETTKRVLSQKMSWLISCEASKRNPGSRLRRYLWGKFKTYSTLSCRLKARSKFVSRTPLEQFSQQCYGRRQFTYLIRLEGKQQ